MIQAVDRALRILTVLQGGRRMSLGEIAQRLDLPPSTVHGLVRTLLAHGWWPRSSTPAGTGSGPAMLQLGQRLPRHPRTAVAGRRSGPRTWPGGPARGAHRGAALRRGRGGAPRAAAGRNPADARGRDRDPGARLRAGQGAARVRRRGRARASSPVATAAQHDRRDHHRSGSCARQLDAIRATGIATEVEEAVLGECGVAAVLERPARRRRRRDRARRADRRLAADEADRRCAAHGRALGLPRARRRVWPPLGHAPKASEMGTRRRRPRPA